LQPAWRYPVAWNENRKTQNGENDMIIENVRLAYVHLEEPRAAAEGADPKYSVTCIIPKAHPQVAEMKAAMKAAVAAKWGDKPPKGLRSPLRDGDELDDSGNRMRGDEFADAYFLNVSSRKRVDVIAGTKRTPATSEHMRSGNYASVKAGFYAYDQAGNRGVGCGLNGVWITRKGDPLGGSSEAWNETTKAEDFSAIAERATAAGQQEGDIF
jgi:hypothetical protein